MQYKLVIREHEDYGEQGIAIVDNPRDYHEPAISGLVLAHDILEHPATPHHNGIADELMALGGIYWIRLQTGLSLDLSGRGRSRPLEDASLQSDITQQIQALWAFDLPDWPGRQKRHPPKRSVRAWCEELVGQALSYCLREERETWLDLLDCYSISSNELAQQIRASFPLWIHEGIRRAKRRFPNQRLACCVFEDIATQAHRWLQTADEGQTATLSVSLSKGRAALEETYPF